MSSVLKTADSLSPKFQPMESRFPPVNMPSSRFYLPSPTSVPVFPYSPYYAGYVSPEMSFAYPRQDIRVSPSYMGQCYHPAIHGIPHHSKDEEKPTQSYIGLISKAILSSPQQKLVLGDIYNYIMTNYPYFRNKGPGWRNSVRHNLSLNDCFVKMGRSPNGKGHFWAINPINYDDFSRGEYKRKRASRRNQEREQEHLRKFERISDTPCNTYTISDGLEKRGFHIETLLSNKWEEINSSETHKTMSAFTVVSPVLLKSQNSLNGHLPESHVRLFDFVK